MRLRIRSSKLVATLTLAALAIAPAAAQGTGSRQTRDFVQAAAQSDQFEILEAKTALAQSQDDNVRAFAQAMIEAHQQTSVVLRRAATKAGLDQPKPGISGDQSMFLASLQSQRGADFDRTYAEQQILAHHAALAVEGGYAASGDNPTIRQTAADAVSVITNHLRMAEQMKAAITGTGRIGGP